MDDDTVKVRMLAALLLCEAATARLGEHPEEVRNPTGSLI